MQPTLGEYFCNPFFEALLDVTITLGGYFSAEGVGVLESIPKKIELPVIPSRGCVRYTISTEDEFNEMAVDWSVSYRTATSDVQCVSFSSFKMLADAQKYSDVPLLGGPGRIVPRNVAFE